MLLEQKVPEAIHFARGELVEAVVIVGIKVQKAATAAMRCDSALNVLGDEICLADLGDVAIAADDALIGDRDTDLDWTLREAALDHAKELPIAQSDLVRLEEPPQHIGLPPSLLNRGRHPDPLAAEDPYELSVGKDLDFTADALGLDDEEPVRVNNEMVHLGDLTVVLHSEVVKYQNLRAVIAERPPQIERHVLLGTGARLSASRRCMDWIGLLRDHRSNVPSLRDKVVCDLRFGFQVADILLKSLGEQSGNARLTVRGQGRRPRRRTSMKSEAPRLAPLACPHLEAGLGLVGSVPPAVGEAHRR